MSEVLATDWEQLSQIVLGSSEPFVMKVDSLTSATRSSTLCYKSTRFLVGLDSFSYLSSRFSSFSLRISSSAYFSCNFNFPFSVSKNYNCINESLTIVEEKYRVKKKKH